MLFEYLNFKIILIYFQWVSIILVDFELFYFNYFSTYQKVIYFFHLSININYSTILFHPIYYLQIILK